MDKNGMQNGTNDGSHVILWQRKMDFRLELDGFDSKTVENETKKKQVKKKKVVNHSIKIYFCIC